MLNLPQDKITKPVDSALQVGVLHLALACEEKFVEIPKGFQLNVGKSWHPLVKVDLGMVWMSLRIAF